MSTKVIKNALILNFSYINEYGNLHGRSYNVSVKTSIDADVSEVKNSLYQLEAAICDNLYVIQGVSLANVSWSDVSTSETFSLEFYPKEFGGFTVNTNIPLADDPVLIETKSFQVNTYFRYLVMIESSKDDAWQGFEYLVTSSISSMIKTLLQSTNTSLEIESVILDNNESKADNLYSSQYSSSGVYWIDDYQEYRLTGYTSTIKSPPTFQHRVLVDSYNDGVYISPDSITIDDNENIFVDAANFGSILFYADSDVHLLNVEPHIDALNQRFVGIQELESSKGIDLVFIK